MLRWRRETADYLWGDLLFVTSAVSGRKDATFKPGLYGDGDASDDRSSHRWVLSAVDKRSGKIRFPGRGGRSHLHVGGDQLDRRDADGDAGVVGGVMYVRALSTLFAIGKR